MKAIRNPSRKKESGASAGLNRESASRIMKTSTSACPTTIELRGISVHFPFKPYACQEEYMGKVLDALNRGENALLESPTGTGKTLCLLCSTLAWQREQAKLLHQNGGGGGGGATQVAPAASQLGDMSSSGSSSSMRRVPTILYASRTHSQLSQVVRELRNTRYRPKHAVLGSREQMCVHPKVKTATATAWDINHDCQKLNKERKCKYRNNLEGFVPDSNVRGEGTMIQPVLDMEELVDMGKTRKVCPFYYTRSLVSDAELIMIPYNYLFDKDARESTLAEVPWDNAIVVFDEAHNLESFASDSASFDLTTLQIAGCISELTRTIHYIEANPTLSEFVSVKDVIRMKAMFLHFEEHIIQRVSPKQAVYSGEYMMSIFTEGMSINHANHIIFLSELAKVTDILLEMRGASSTKSSGSPQLETFASCVKRVFGESTEGRCFAKAQCYRVHVTEKQQGAGRTISYWCFAPSLAMQELSNLKVRSILVTSGTLSPLPSYSMELGLPFPHTLENPHIISDDQIHVRVIGHGVSGKVLTSSYQRRDDAEYILELGSTLASLARIIPGGMLVFFPSYGVMETCVERWGGPSSRKSQFGNQTKNKFFQARHRKGSSSSNQYSFPHAPNYYASTSTNNQMNQWKRMLCHKGIILEPRSTGDLSDAIAEFHRFLNQPKSTGCILMGVCRGKISEGIDFRDNMCRAVVITGLPFAPYLDPKVKLKREYLDNLRAGERLKASGEGGFGDEAARQAAATPVTLSGAEWYTQQAHRAVNQAVGRVIRSKVDYGAVLLLDSRFGEPRNQQGLSKWVRPHIQGDDGFGAALRGLNLFYKKAQEQEQKRYQAIIHQQQQPPQTATDRPRRAGLALEYENDGLLVNTKIAVVQKPAADTDPNGDLAKSSQESSGFFRPEQIIGHVDLKQATKSRVSLKQEDINVEEKMLKPVHGLEALYQGKSKGAPPDSKLKGPRDQLVTTKSAWSSINVARKETGKKHASRPSVPVKRLGPSSTSSSESSKRNDGAVLFFQKVKAKASSEDYVAIREAIIEMRSQGDKRDVTGYLRSARVLVGILLSYENFDSPANDPGQGLLELLYSLLPQTFRRDVEKITLSMNLKRSEFMHRCKALLDADQYNAISSSVQDFLLEVCFPDSGVRSSASFLREARPIVKNITSRPDLVKLFLRLVPSRHKSSIYALVEELKSSYRVQALRQAEKANTGEDSVDTSLFSKPQETLKKQLAQGQETKEEAETRKSMEAALMRAEEVNREKRERLQAQQASLVKQEASYSKNPYAARSKPVPASLKHRPPTQDPMLTAKRVRRSPITSPSKSDPVVKALREAERSAFVDGRSDDGQRKIKSNLPHGFTCKICDLPPHTLFLAKCGHTACSRCWSQWLKKSPTCPTCRKAVDKTQLEQVVFQEKSGAGVPTLSQLCPREDRNSESSDDDEELEVVKG